MFDSLTVSRPETSGPARALLGSVAIHAAAVGCLLLLSLSGVFSPPLTLARMATPVVLPPREPAPVAPKLRPRRAFSSQAQVTAPSMELLPSTPREVRTFVAPSIPTAAAAVTASLALDPATTQVTVHAPRLDLASQMPVVNAPQPKLGNLSEARGDAANAPRSGVVHSAGLDNHVPAGVIANAAPTTVLGGFGAASGDGMRGGMQAATMRTSGFGTPAGPKNVPPAPPNGQSAKSGFGDAVAAKPETAVGAKRADDADKSLEILTKPKPEYTAEARELRIEGEVLVEALFPASGSVRVVRVVRGLGHGLDQAAQAAVGRIQFHPARRDGVAIDTSAVVHIVFQLAY